MTEHFKESQEKFEISTAVIPFKSDDYQFSVKVLKSDAGYDFAESRL